MANDIQVDTFLDEGFLRMLERFKVLAKKGLKGPTAGEHLSWRSGASPDFLEHRKYQMGDDFRYIDWNVYGRLDRIFIKLFRAEEELAIHLLLDTSRSMAFGQPSKDIYAKKTAAALAYLGLVNLDRVGISAFNQSLIHPRPPQKGKTVFIALLRYLLSLQPSGQTDLSASLAQYAAGSRRGLFIVISDLLDAQGVEQGLDVLARGRSDVALIQVLSAQELAPAVKGYTVMKDMESGHTRKMTVDRQMLQAHGRAWARYLQGIREACMRRGILYTLCDTRVPFEAFLIDFLTRGSGGP